MEMEQIKNETVEVVDVVVSDQEKDQIRERCEREAKRAEAIIAKEKTDALQEQIDTLERRKDRLHRLLEPVLTMNFASGAEFKVTAIGILLFILGFIIGSFLGVNVMLDHHGPTVTLVGTWLANAIYAAVGIFFGGFFCWLFRDYVHGELKSANKRIKKLRKQINSIAK